MKYNKLEMYHCTTHESFYFFVAHLWRFKAIILFAKLENNNLSTKNALDNYISQKSFKILFLLRISMVTKKCRLFWWTGFYQINKLGFKTFLQILFWYWWIGIFIWIMNGSYLLKFYSIFLKPFTNIVSTGKKHIECMAN